MDITVQDLKNKIDSKEGVHILDVREEWEYEEGNIEGAINLSLYSIPNGTDEIDHLKDEVIYVHCRSGKRSLTAQQLLITAGFKNPVNVLGGFEAWKAII